MLAEQLRKINQTYLQKRIELEKSYANGAEEFDILSEKLDTLNKEHASTIKACLEDFFRENPRINDFRKEGFQKALKDIATKPMSYAKRQKNLDALCDALWHVIGIPQDLQRISIPDSHILIENPSSASKDVYLAAIFSGGCIAALSAILYSCFGMLFTPLIGAGSAFIYITLKPTLSYQKKLKRLQKLTTQADNLFSDFLPFLEHG